MIIDLHVHTRLSACSELSLDEIIAYAPKRGLDGVCITDHQCYQAQDELARQWVPDNLCIIVGMEYRTPDGDFLVFGPLAHLTPGLSARRLLARVAQLGGAAVAAHPFRQQAPTTEFVIQEGLCRIVESINGRNSPYENQRLSQWRQAYNCIECAGSDAHSLPELGKSATCFDIPIRTSSDLIYALNNGLCKPHLNSGTHGHHAAAPVPAAHHQPNQSF